MSVPLSGDVVTLTGSISERRSIFDLGSVAVLRRST